MAATESSPSSDGSCLSEPKSRAVFAPIPLPESAREVNFGVQVTGLDLAALRDDEFADLRRALYEHHVVVVRDQGHVTPQEQLAITRRFDADAAGEYGHGSNLALMKAGVLSNDLVSLPSAPEVKARTGAVPASNPAYIPCPSSPLAWRTPNP